MESDLHTFVKEVCEKDFYLENLSLVSELRTRSRSLPSVSPPSQSRLSTTFSCSHFPSPPRAGLADSQSPSASTLYEDSQISCMFIPSWIKSLHLRRQCIAQAPDYLPSLAGFRMKTEPDLPSCWNRVIWESYPH